MAPKDEWSFALWPDENSPIDAVFRRRAASGEMAFEFVQLKEVAPEAVNPKHSLQAVLDDLPTKYSSGDGFTVGIHVHHNTTTDLGALRLPKLSGGRIWLFGAGGEPPHDSFLVGDLLVEPVVCYFSYPRFQAGESITQWTGALDDAL
jgi:hypothetical protein